MARIGTLVVAALLLLPGVARAADWSPQKAARVDALVRQFLKPRASAPAVPALSIAIGMNDQLVLAKGYGLARPDASASAQTVYHIGSLTKQFTAAAVLRLIETGARTPVSAQPLHLDTPMREIFEGVDRWAAPDEPPITMRSLLTMTSNLPNFTLRPPAGADPWGAVATPQLLAALKALPPHGWPNTFEYSNTGYFLLASALDAVFAGERRHTDFRGYVRAAIVSPLGLSQTGFVDDYAPGSDVAQPNYRRRPAFAQPHWLDGCGDMASNVIDLFAWNKALMNRSILNDQSVRLMFSDAARVDPLTYYGMGWFIGHDGDWDSFHHSGSVPGYTAYNAILKQTRTGAWLSVTLLTNSDGVEGLDQLADEILYEARAD
jgi:CubicO group peptidase (beta-lactamase class C family)